MYAITRSKFLLDIMVSQGVYQYYSELILKECLDMLYLPESILQLKKHHLYSEYLKIGKKSL